MGRPVFNYELSDPDFSWLVSNFKENNPNYTYVESSGVPIVFINSQRAVEFQEVQSNAESFDLPPQVSDKKSDTVGENK